VNARRWPLLLIAMPAAVAIWSGWVGLGQMSGFGPVAVLPGIAHLTINTAITLPVGVESYGAYALGAWLAPDVAGAARTFARRSALGALGLGMAGQVIYHLLAAAHAVRAPWPVVVLVSCMPVVTLGFGAALTHLLRASPLDTTVARDAPAETPAQVPAVVPAAAPKATRKVTPRRAKADRIRGRRPDITNAELARMAGVSVRTLQRWQDDSAGDIDSEMRALSNGSAR
jgi:hypothetical protein